AHLLGAAGLGLVLEQARELLGVEHLLVVAEAPGALEEVLTPWAVPLGAAAIGAVVGGCLLLGRGRGIRAVLGRGGLLGAACAGLLAGSLGAARPAAGEERRGGGGARQGGEQAPAPAAVRRAGGAPRERSPTSSQASVGVRAVVVSVGGHRRPLLRVDPGPPSSVRWVMLEVQG